MSFHAPTWTPNASLGLPDWVSSPFFQYPVVFLLSLLCLLRASKKRKCAEPPLRLCSNLCGLTRFLPLSARIQSATQSSLLGSASSSPLVRLPIKASDWIVSTSIRLQVSDSGCGAERSSADVALLWLGSLRQCTMPPETAFFGVERPCSSESKSGTSCWFRDSCLVTDASFSDYALLSSVR